MSWHSGTYYALDTESTGVSVHDDRIVTATIVRLDNGVPGDTRTWLLNPGIDIPAEATAIHGITTEKARTDGDQPDIALADIGWTIDAIVHARLPLVVFNAAFDLSLLHNELRRHCTTGLADLDLTGVIDPMVLAKCIDRINKVRTDQHGDTLKYTLPATCARYKVPFTESHDATADAIGAGRLAHAIAVKHDHLQTYGPRELHTLQRTAREADQRGFAQWAARKGFSDRFDIDLGWPLHTRITSTEKASA